MADKVEIDQVQSIVFTAHGDLAFSSVLFFVVNDGAAARQALASLIQQELNFGIPAKDRLDAVHVALTHAGLLALGVSSEAVRQLDGAFVEGIATPQRSRALGDASGTPSDPTNWKWTDQSVDALLLVYASSSDRLEAKIEQILELMRPGWAERHEVRLATRTREREPFGFRDGLSRIEVDLGTGQPRPNTDLVPAGEVILGYDNFVGARTEAGQLGKNGSYLVLRQLVQDVQSFWGFWRQQSGQDDVTAVWMAAKAVGRWPNGMPVAGQRPTAQPDYDEEAALAFIFDSDRFGDRCPMGAHIRRANPRDALRSDPQLSLSIVAQHRILRRGRIFGDAVPPEWLPQVCQVPDSVELANPGQRGLAFVALCGDIARQFEFIQQTWLSALILH